MSGVLQPQYLTSAVVVADHSREPHNGTRGLLAHEVLVFGEQNRLIRQRGTNYQRHR